MYPESIKAKLFFPIAWLWFVTVFLVVSGVFASVTLVMGNIQRDEQVATIVANQAKIQKILDERTPIIKMIQDEQEMVKQRLEITERDKADLLKTTTTQLLNHQQELVDSRKSLIDLQKKIDVLEKKLEEK